MASTVSHYLIRRIVILLITIVISIIIIDQFSSINRNVAADTKSVSQSDTPMLTKAQSLEKELQGGQSHSYSIAVEADHYLEIKVEQQSIDVTAIVYSPENRKVYEIDSPNGRQGLEPVYLITDNKGQYRMEIVVNNKLAAAGRYKVELTELKPATTAERELCQAQQLTLQARRLYVAGKYRDALPIAEQAVSIREKLLNPEDPQLALSLIYLADLYKEDGKFSKAEPLFQRALAIREKVFGAEHSEVASALSSLAMLYFEKYDFEKTEPLLQRALVIQERLFESESPEVAVILNNLSDLYFDKLETEKAKSFTQRALAINEKVYGPDHPTVAYSIHNLAANYHVNNLFEKAAPLYQRAVTIYEKTYGPDHPIVANTLQALTLTYFGLKDFDNAEKASLRNLAIREQSYSSDHPSIASALNNLAALYTFKGDFEKEISIRERADEIREQETIRNLTANSEKEKLLYLKNSNSEVDIAISMMRVYEPDNPRSIRLALTGVLRRKGRAFDAMTDSIASLRRRANLKDQVLLEKLTKARLQYSQFSLRGPENQNIEQYQSELKRLSEEIENLEKQIDRRSAELKIASQSIKPITLDAIQQAIPADAALIEIVAYDYAVKFKSTISYIAFVLTNQGDPLYVNLGDIESIDLAVLSLRAFLTNKNSNINTELKPEARALDKLIMQPVRKLLGDKKRLLISPDGALNLIPFEALVDEHDKYLVENYQISYLSSGRDLLRLQNGIKNKQSPLIIADPNFGNGPGPELGDETLEPLKRLTATSAEATQIKTQLKQAKLLTQSQATKQALLSVSSPEILHLATHGYFLRKLNENEQLSDNQRAALLSESESADRAAARRNRIKLQLQHPLLRSGLFLASANVKNSEGTITALEVAGLDLWGTKLVVLSACDTGLGDVVNGDGVYGLRRSLVLAGAESQVMSLWKISDQGTKDLMVAYYRALKLGKGRSAALKQVQLSFLKRPDRKHPYYWASFIQSGEWANLDGKR